MNRRNFLKNAGVGTATSISLGGLGTVLTSCNSSPDSNCSDSDEQTLFIGDNIAVANTQYGKIRGYISNGIYTFLGVPYGADTSGKNRFMPPQAPEPWSDIRPAVFWGDTAPQNMDNRWPNRYGTFVDHWNFFDVTENCLMVNVWTPSITDDKKRPVLVWMHGGGFTSGSGIEQDGYHGESLSKYGDIVICTLNHRLGPIGFTDLSGIDGEKYKHSGNVGVLDLVAALKWVNNNISNFGGDPGNVTIMGQSGGGAKVCNITAMPAAKGLIHKVVPLSGNVTEAADQERSRKLGSYVLKEAGLKESEVDKLQDIPWKEYLTIANRASAKFAQENPPPTGARVGFSPVADGVNLPKGKFFSSQFGGSDIPMMLSSTFHEWNPNRDDASLEQITLEEVEEKLQDRYGNKASSIVAAYAKDFPNVRPVELWAMILSSRLGVMNTAKDKLTQSSPVYVAWYGWQPPLFDNRIRAFHCVDICFWFLNTDKMITHTGGGSRPRKLSYKMADALLAFMHTGNPNTTSLPDWPKFTEAEGATMILNDHCEVQHHPDKNGLESLA